MNGPATSALSGRGLLGRKGEKILSAEAEVCALPMRRSFRNGRFEVKHREVALLRVRWLLPEGERWSLGEVAPLPGWSRESLEECLDGLVAFSRELDLAILEKLPALRWGLEMSRFLVDLLAEEQNRDQDGPQEVLIPCQLAVGLTKEDLLFETIERALVQGFKTLKLKVGGRPWQEEIKILVALRERFPSVGLRLDGNQSFSLEDAQAFLNALSGLQVQFFEEPVKCKRLDELAALGRESAIPLGADESLQNVDTVGAENLVGIGALILKPGSLGGIDRCRGLGASAKKAGVPVVMSTLLESALGRHILAELAYEWQLTGPQGLATGGLFESDLFSVPLSSGSYELLQGRRALARFHGEVF